MNELRDVPNIVVSESDIYPYVCSIDIGGTLIKISYTTFDHLYSGSYSNIHCNISDNKCHLKKKRIIQFRYFHTHAIEDMIVWLIEKGICGSKLIIPVTGGGAYKYENLLKTRLGVTIVKCDEMECTVTGINHFIPLEGELFEFNLITRKRCPVSLNKPLYPFLIVNIGSGVSILKVKNECDFTRITGSSIGGGTVLGLGKLLLGVSTFDEIFKLSQSGSSCLDLVVKDLYGDTAGSGWLPPQTLASSFGRLYTHWDPQLTNSQNINPHNIAKSLIHMVAYNIGYLSYLVSVVHKIKRIFFSGKFINNHDITMEAITHSIQFYEYYYPIPNCEEDKSIDMMSSSNIDSYTSINESSRSLNMGKYLTNGSYEGSDSFDASFTNASSFQILFLKHDGYLGAIGAILLQQKNKMRVN